MVGVSPTMIWSCVSLWDYVVLSRWVCQVYRENLNIRLDYINWYNRAYSGSQKHIFGFTWMMPRNPRNHLVVKCKGISQAIDHTCIALICFSSLVQLGIKQEWILCSEHWLRACGLCYLDVESFTERCVMSVGSCSEGSCENRQGTSSSWSLFASHQIWQPSLLFWSSGPSSWGDVFL